MSHENISITFQTTNMNINQLSVDLKTSVHLYWHMLFVFREERDAMLKESRIALEEERAAARDRLEDQKKRDLERLKAESEEELQAERTRLLREREEKLNSLKQEVIGSEA